MKRIWLKHYPNGILENINPDAYSSLIALLEESIQRYRTLPAFYHLGTTLTYQELNDYSRAFAAYCQQALQLKQGDRIALMMQNSLPYPIALWGALRAGLIVVNVNPLYTASEWIHQLNDCGAETILVSAPFIDVVQQGLSATIVKNIIVTDMGDFLSPIKSERATDGEGAINSHASTSEAGDARRKVIWKTPSSSCSAVTGVLRDELRLDNSLGKEVDCRSEGEHFSRAMRLAGYLVDFYFKLIKKKKLDTSISYKISFKEVLAEGKNIPFQPVLINAESIAFLQYTGGTTGIAKGAMLTHRNLIANILQTESWVSPKIKYGQEIMITALPLYHVFSLLANCLLVTRIGGLSVLISDPRYLSSVISTMRQFPFTLITGVNTLFNGLLHHRSFKKCNFTYLKISLGGGMPVQGVVADAWKKATGCPLSEAYGLTETSSCVAINPLNGDQHQGSIGLPVPSTDIAILDDAGNEVAIGQSGELAVKGPQVMRGYWQNSIETQKVINTNGWLLTGDIAIIDSNGFISIVDRKKDMVIVSGFKVYPNEIEDTLMHIPGVIETAVISVPDEHTGEAVKAFIVTHRTDLTDTEVKAFCHNHFTSYKRPKYIELRSEPLPKSPVGKILRRLLK